MKPHIIESPDNCLLFLSCAHFNLHVIIENDQGWPITETFFKPFLISNSRGACQIMFL